MKAQGVTVVELDTEFSGYLDDAAFAGAVDNVKTVSQYIHSQGMKVVVYYPGGEVLSEKDAVKAGKSMAKQHPDWVQYDIATNKTNVFIGSGQVFWVDPGVESAWMDFNSGWKDYFAKRVALLAGSGADGVWIDVPLYNDITGLWCDASPRAAAQFKADTGRTVPKAVNYKDENFRAWLQWRHTNINNFLKYACSAARKVNPNFLCIIETVTIDYLYATRTGFDGPSLIGDGITHVWEIDVVSLDNSMRTALEDDWVSFISMYKYSKSGSAPNPSWAFTYGIKEDDARHSIVTAVATGNNVYEVKSPKKEVSTDTAMRTRMYKWIAANEDRLYRSQRLARIGLFHSSENRDFIDDSTEGLGLFCTTSSPLATDKTWWAQGAAAQSCYNFQGLGEYRGAVKALLHSHLPFEVIVSPRLSLVNLAQYDTIILPNVQAITDAQAATFRSFVQKGGNLIVTGPKPGLLNDVGTERPELILSDLLGFTKAAIPASKTNQVPNGGKVSYIQSTAGWKYLNATTDAASFNSLVTANAAILPTFVSTTADRRVHFEVSHLPEWNEVYIHMVNYIGVNGKYQLTKTSFAVTIDLLQLSSKFVKKNVSVSSVSVISPDPSFVCQDATTGTTPAFTSDGLKLIAQVDSLDQYQVIVLKYTSSGAASTASTTPTTTTIPTTTTTAATTTTTTATTTTKLLLLLLLPLRHPPLLL
ncbi:hypothetical protein BDR26DRAFT_96646 [Obelidium mucronatum]|nr:hypothetical protein BDR26DRAFT_96646 [Obelidium mucronatum]